MSQGKCTVHSIKLKVTARRNETLARSQNGEKRGPKLAFSPNSQKIEDDSRLDSCKHMIKNSS